MANFLITTPGQVTRGTTDADNIVYDGGGLSASTVIGNTGADTITINGTGTFQSTDFMLNGGHDVMKLSFSASTIASSNFFGGGKGNDLIELTSGAQAANVFVAKGGSGRDTITLDGISGSQISIGGNAGHDAITFSAEATKSYVGGGKGNDTIKLSGEFAGSIYGGLLNDQITVESITDKTVLNGDAGADSITILGVAGSGVYINGNADNDTITVDLLAGDNTVAGGNNADLITVSAFATGVIAGGKGHDVINVSGAGTTTVYGGLGADTINLLGDATGVKVNAGDSRVGAMDIVSGGAVGKSVNTVTAVAAGSGELVNNGVTAFKIDNGVILSGDLRMASGMTITATVAEIDKLTQLSKGGNTVAFEKDSNTYLFIQGGTVGSTADDIVVQFNGTGIASISVTDKTQIKLA